MNPGQITFRSLWSAALTMAVSLPLAAQEAPPDPFLAVTGTTEARIPTDRARIEFMVETQAATAREAAAQNADRMQLVIRAVREAGRETVTVETGGYNLSPVYSRASRYQPDIPTIEAYRAANYVRVRANELARVGALIDAAIAAGSNRIASMRFEARDPEPARLEALRGAVAKAQGEAVAVAEALGVPLGMPQEVSTGADYGYPPPVMREAMAMGMAQAAPTPVEPGEQIVRATVTIRYRLLGR